MDIIVKAIPHAAQRYATCGDWWYDADGNLQVRVSQEIPQVSQDLVVIHELAEARMCAANGITQEQVDQYDMNYEANRKADDESEPGDHKEAPYFVQHQLATCIEKLCAYQMGVNLDQHEADITALFESVQPGLKPGEQPTAAPDSPS